MIVLGYHFGGLRGVGVGMIGLIIKFYKKCRLLILYSQILKEDPTYPEALIGRGTAHAFQRELEAAIADFTKVLEYFKSDCCSKNVTAFISE